MYKRMRYCCPLRDFAEKAKSQGDTLATHMYIKESTYRLLTYTVSIPQKISISLNRGRKESVGNDDVPIVCALKYKMVRMT